MNVQTDRSGMGRNRSVSTTDFSSARLAPACRLSSVACQCRKLPLDAISRFIEGNPTLKILALSFLILIGVMLTAEAMGMHIKKGYIYFAMAFALFVEVLNMRTRQRRVAKERAAVADVAEV